MSNKNGALVIPAPLQLGNKVAILSPSGRVDAAYVEGAAAVLQGWGLRPSIAPHALAVEGRFAGDDDARLSDLLDALRDPECSAIFCSRGGYGAIRLLPHLPLDVIARHPKWLVGYSDITLLHARFAEAGVASIHAPMAKHLAQNRGEDVCSQMLHETLFGDRLIYSSPSHPLNRTGCVTAPLIGGNLSILYSLQGTPYAPNMENRILFIEDIAEAPYQVERMLYNLRLSGKLAGLAGLVVGHFSQTNEDPLLGHSIYEMIASLTKEYGYPCCFGFPVGHSSENLPLVQGDCYTLSVSDCGVALER